MSLKCAYRTLGSGDLLQGGKGPMVDGRYFPLEVWPGPPQKLDESHGYGPEKWSTWVWIDVKGSSQGKGKVICSPGRPDPSTIKPEVSYGVDQFINFPLSSEDARVLNKWHRDHGENVAELKTDDFAVLTAFHAASREITRWTWQTFWWLPDPDNPKLPSAKSIADDRPARLTGAARHYAMVPCYSMLLPDQPLSGGEDKGRPVYAYNPYLEAFFGPGHLHGLKNRVGLQSNCMSCHAMACYTKDGPPLDSELYIGDQYVDLKDPTFRGRLKTDFLWSVPRVALKVHE
jgi:hypothetical protein